MKVRLALCIAAFFAMLAPAMAQDASLAGLAPADEYFGHYNLSVLGIANTIRDSGARIDAGTDPQSMVNGPLSFVSDAIKDWESKYPTDPWIAKDLLALEAVYLRVPGDGGFGLAKKTEAWLVADYPDSDQAAQARSELAANDIPYMPQQVQAAQVPQQPQYVPPAPPQYVPPQYAPPQYVPPHQAYAPPPAPVYQSQYPGIPSYAIPWERYAALRAPLPPRRVYYYQQYP